MEIRYSGHSAYRTEYHIVWIPKYRRRILNPGVRGYLRKLFPKVMMSLPGCEIIEYHMRDDHIHLLMIIPPRYAVGDVIGKLKGWSPGYFVTTVGIDERRVLKYLKWQEAQDLGQAKLEF